MRRNGALVWLTGIDQAVAGQKASADDYEWQNGAGTNVAALSQSGSLSLQGQLAASSAVLGNPLTAPNGGTGLSSYSIGDMIWASATNALAKITGNTTTTRKFLRQVGSAGVPQSPAWDTLVDGDIPATLSANARVAVRKNSTGGAVGTRRQINFIEGSNVTITVADDNANEEVDVTIAAAGGGGSYPWTHIGKPADTGRSATTALTADPDLQVALAANTTYAVRLRVYYGTGTTPDFKYDLNFTGTFLGGQFHRVAWLPSGTQGGIGSDTALNVSVSLTATSGSRGFIEIFGRLGVGASGGTFSFRWAQNTSDPGTTSVFTGSELMYMVIN